MKFLVYAWPEFLTRTGPILSREEQETMVYFKPLSLLIAASIFLISQGAGAVGLTDIPNAHRGKFLPPADSLGSALIDGQKAHEIKTSS